MSETMSEVIKLFSCSTQLSMKFQLCSKTKIVKNKDICCFKSKEEGKDQESIQSSTTPDTEHHMGKRQLKNTIKHQIQERQEVSPFPAGDQKL